MPAATKWQSRFELSHLLEFCYGRCLGHSLALTPSGPGKLGPCVYLKPKIEDQLPSGHMRPSLPGSQGQGDTVRETRTLHAQRGRCYPEIFITKIFCKPKSLSCNYIQNGACFLPSSLKINSRNHAPSALLFRPLPFPGVRYTRYENLQAASLELKLHGFLGLIPLLPFQNSKLN